MATQESVLFAAIAEFSVCERTHFRYTRGTKTAELVGLAAFFWAVFKKQPLSCHLKAATSFVARAPGPSS